jgi:uncharacterized protein YciI
MQFIVSGYDGKDECAMDRRMSVREAHLAMGAKMIEKGRFLYAVAMLNEGEKMIGSLIVCEFDSRQAMEKEWLDKEPYVLGKVWERIEITRAQVPPFWDKK